MRYPNKNFALWALLPFGILLLLLVLTGGEPLKEHVPQGAGLPFVGLIVVAAIAGAWWLLRNTRS